MVASRPDHPISSRRFAPGARWLRLLLVGGALLLSSNAWAVNGIFCYYLVDPKDQEDPIVLREPPWDLSGDEEHLSAEDRRIRERLGHLIISVVDGECDGLSRSEFKKKLRKLRQEIRDEANQPAPPPPPPPDPTPPPPEDEEPLVAPEAMPQPEPELGSDFD